MSHWLLPLQDLTPDQLRVVELPPTQHRVIFGPPGSGKTQILIHRAAFLRDAYRVPTHRLHMFVFTNVLKDYIRSSLALVGLPADSVSTFASWCKKFHEKHVSKKLPWKGKTFDFEAIHRAVLQHLKHRGPQDALDFVLVDEGQDLGCEAFEILRRVSKHVTVFADHQQQIFDSGASEAEILTALGLRRRNATLLADYRNSPDVAELASYFIADDALRRQYLTQIKAKQSVRERPLYYIAASHDAEMDRLAEVTQQRMTMNQRVGIIVPQTKYVYGYANALAERGVTVEKAVGKWGKKDKATPAHFDNLVPKIVSYHSAKGLTFDCAMLPRLREDSFPHDHGKARERLLFVGIARATQWVYLSTTRGNEMCQGEFLREAAAHGRLVIQDGSQPQPAAKPKAEQFDFDDEFDIL